MTSQRAGRTPGTARPVAEPDPEAELAWLRELRDAVGAYLAHRDTEYPSQPARSAGFWVAHEGLERVWRRQP